MTRPRDRLDDALDGLVARELEALIDRAQLRLRSCVLCGEAGAEPVAIRRGNAKGRMMVCPACFERHRLPDKRGAD